jgi:hypothetical protein
VPRRAATRRRAARRDEVAPVVARAGPRDRPGSHERAASPWLSTPGNPSDTFRAYLAAERNLVPWGLWPGIAIAPATVLGACLDWAVHLAASPAKQLELAHFAAEQGLLALQTPATAPRSSPCRRTSASPIRPGSCRRTGSSPGVSSFRSNGGNARPRAFRVSRATTRKW